MLRALTLVKHSVIEDLHASVNQQVEQKKAQQQEKKAFDGTSRLGDGRITDGIKIGVAHRDRQGAVLGEVEVLAAESRENGWKGLRQNHTF